MTGERQEDQPCEDREDCKDGGDPTYVAEFNRDGFVVGLSVMMLYFAPPGAGCVLLPDVIRRPRRRFNRLLRCP
jgi:hypothetical protein